MAKITEITSHPMSWGMRTWLFVRIRTDDGYEGLGEGTLPQRTGAIMATIDHYADYLIGKDPSQIERHWQVLFRNAFQRGGVVQHSALSAVELALWDIRGKVLDRPVWDLLGGLSVTEFFYITIQRHGPLGAMQHQGRSLKRPSSSMMRGIERLSSRDHLILPNLFLMKRPSMPQQQT